jgi:hypothetical protein
MPDLDQKLHLRRTERVVLWELQLGGEDATLVGGIFGTIDHHFPNEHASFIYGPRVYALDWVLAEENEFVGKPLSGYGCGHLGGRC